MALRTKTIEYVFPQNEATLAPATRFDFASKTLFIPETTTRTFRSVMIEITMRSHDATAVALTSWLIGIKLGAAAFSDVTVTDTIAMSGEHASWIFSRDVTSYFNTNFGSGASQTSQVGVQFGGANVANIAAKLIITYESEEQTTRVKTVKIPLESFVGALTTTLTEMGTNQVPALDTFLPEATKTYRNIWFEVTGNEVNGGNVDATLDLALDAEAADPDNLHENALNSDVWYRRIWQRDAMTTNVVHAFKMAVSSTGGFTFNHVSVLLCVTYEYDHASSTTILNSIWMPFSARQPMGRTVAGNQSVLSHEFWIEEPTTIALVQSGVRVNFGALITVTGINVACGSQADRAYTNAGAVLCGQYALTQRVDSGGAQGAGISLARGKNTFTLECYSTDTSQLAWPIFAMLFLNYTSGKHASGDGVHNHTTIWSFMDHQADANQLASASIAPNVPEASYWVNHVAICSEDNFAAGVTAQLFSIVAERLANEGPGDGWEDVWQSGQLCFDNELGVYSIYAGCQKIFDRYPNETDVDRLAIETARVYRVYMGSASMYLNLYMSLTYHAITFAISGTISGSGGGTVQIKAYTAPTTGGRRLIDSTSRVGNGTYSMTHYDNTENVFVEARESASLVGRSDDGVAA